LAKEKKLPGYSPWEGELQRGDADRKGIFELGTYKTPIQRGKGGETRKLIKKGKDRVTSDVGNRNGDSAGTRERNKSLQLLFVN